MLNCICAGIPSRSYDEGNGLRVGGQHDKQSCPDICLDKIDQSSSNIKTLIMVNKNVIKELDTKVNDISGKLRGYIETNKKNIFSLNTPVPLSD